jgi:serine/threonine protein phosphatase PrpC
VTDGTPSLPEAPELLTPPAAISAEGAVVSAPATAPAVPAAPARAVWATLTPEAPWCPEEWRAHLDDLAPGLIDTATAAAAHEATGSLLRADGWTLVLSARRGRLHAHRGEHREDAGHLLHFEQGWCAAVADGAGSAKYSRIGSALATYTVSHTLREALLHGRAAREALGPALQHAAQRTHECLRAFCTRTGLPPRELRTTLLVAAVHQGMLGVMQVGDGAMAFRHHDGTLTHPHAAATGDYSGEVAHFLPDDGALEQLLVSLSQRPVNDVQTVLLASDGVEDPWYPFTRHAGALIDTLLAGSADETALPASLVPARTESVLRAGDPVQALAEWLAFEKRGENDDRTLCIVHAMR